MYKKTMNQPKTEISNDFKFLKTIHSQLAAELVPTLVPAEKMKVLTEGDASPYFAVEEILDITQPVFPVMSLRSPVGVTFTAEFWDSYIGKLSQRPFPGAKSGHAGMFDPGTPPTDLYTVGGKREGNRVWLKIYIPKMGAYSSNEGLIRDAKVGIVHFSIVSKTRDQISVDENGEITEFKAIESVTGERNDVVEYEQGAMDQKVSKKDDEAERLLNKDNIRRYIMPENTYTEVVENLKNQMANGAVSIKKLAADLGFEIVTDQIKASLGELAEIKKITGEKPIESINAMKAREDAVTLEAYTNKRSRLMKEAFGEEGTQEAQNYVRAAAEPHISKTPIDEKQLQEQIEKAKSDPIVMKLSKEKADFTSGSNLLSGVRQTGSGTEKEIIVDIE